MDKAKYQREYFLKNRERLRRWHQQHYIENKEKMLQQSREWYKNNKERKRELKRNWEKRNIEKIRLQRRKWRRSWELKNPEKNRSMQNACHHKRRALLRGDKNKFSANEWDVVRKRNNYKCVICGKIEPEIKLTVDHIIPVSRGGKNNIENIQPLCRRCNSIKNNN